MPLLLFNRARSGPCRAPALLISAAALAGCATGPAPVASAGPTSCASGEIQRSDGQCQAIGIPPDTPCLPGERERDGGGCQSAGVPPEACAAGFEPDGRGGCEVELPEEPCPRGQMLTPGEATCRAVAPCGVGRYGAIPVDEDTEFVDGAYPGEDSDGTQARPWRSIQEGVDAASSGAIVAVAAGRYTESVILLDKPVRLWGRCPAMVELFGPSAREAAIQILRARASGSELHQVALSGPYVGALVAGARSVVLDKVWAHDTGDAGIVAQSSLGATGIAVRGSLVEGAHGSGIYVSGAEASIEGSVVRDADVSPSSPPARGIAIQPYADGTRSTATVRSSIIERNTEVGVLIIKSDADIEGSVVRGTQLDGARLRGYGISVQSDNAGDPSTASIRSTLIDGNETGIVVTGSDVTLDATVVRGSLSQASIAGSGMQAQEDKSGRRSTVTVRSSLFEANAGGGMVVMGSDATVDASIVRDSLPIPALGSQGFGILARPSTDGSGRAVVTVRASLMEQNNEAGMVLFGSDGVIEGSVLRGSRPNTSIELGYGLSLQVFVDTGASSTAVVGDTLIDSNYNAGIYCSSAALELRASTVRDTRTGSSFGDGVLVTTDDRTVKASTVELVAVDATSNARAGILCDHCEGSLLSSASRSNRFGLVLQEAPGMVVDEDNRIEGKTESDWVESGAFDVPDGVPAVP